MKLIQSAFLLLAVFLFSCGEKSDDPANDDPNGCCDANESCCDENETSELNSSIDVNQSAPWISPAASLQKGEMFNRHHRERTTISINGN